MCLGLVWCQGGVGMQRRRGKGLVVLWYVWVCSEREGGGRE